MTSDTIDGRIKTFRQMTVCQGGLSLFFAVEVAPANFFAFGIERVAQSSNPYF